MMSGSNSTMAQQIARAITGMKVREATAEVEPATGAVVQAFTTGTVVQVFLLAGNASTETWSENGPSESEPIPGVEEKG